MTTKSKAVPKSPEELIAPLTAELDSLEDRSSPRARQIRKTIRAIKDQYGIERPHPAGSPTGRLTVSKPAIQPEPEPPKIQEILRTYRAMKRELNERRHRQLFEQNLPESPETVIERVRQTVGPDHPDTITRPADIACRKCHAIPDSENPCRQCGRPRCNCSLKDPDGLCKKCRKGHPTISNTTRNLGKYGKSPVIRKAE